MKKIIITSMMFLTIYCTIESCQKEKDQSKCQSHTMESGFNFYHAINMKQSVTHLNAGRFLPVINYKKNMLNI